MNSWGYLYKITGLRPSQYLNTEMSPNHKYDINTIDFNYIQALKTGIYKIQLPSAESKK